MFRVQVTSPFTDAITGEYLTSGTELEVDSYERLKNIVDRHLGRLVYAKARTKKKKHGPKIMIYQKLLYCIGGIETWDYNLAKIFEDRDLTFIFTYADLDQALRLSKYANVVIDDSFSTYVCDVFISANYDGGPVILDRMTARRYYQTIHSDFDHMKRRVAGWQNFTLNLDPRFDAVIAASDTAQKGLLNGFGIDSTVAVNPLAKADDKPLILVTLSRASEEKGIDKVIRMAHDFNRQGRNFLWFIASTLNQSTTYERQLKEIPQIIIVPPNIYAQGLMHAADYLCQFSLSEAYCYSMHEALQAGVPVLATDFEEAKKVIKDGYNGYLLKRDFSDYDESFIDKIFNKRIKKGFKHSEPVDKIWEDIFNGNL